MKSTQLKFLVLHKPPFRSKKTVLVQGVSFKMQPEREETAHTRAYTWHQYSVTTELSYSLGFIVYVLELT